MKLPNSVKSLLVVMTLFVVLGVGTLLITFCTAGVVLVQLLAAGVNNYLSLGVAILTAIGCNAFLVFNHKIRDYIKIIGAKRR